MTNKYLNQITIMKAMPTILTGISIVGVPLTGIFSARAMKKYLEATEEPSNNLVEAIKAGALPTAIGVGTILSFIFARKADKAAITGLSASMAVLSEELYATKKAIKDEYGEDALKKIEREIHEKQVNPDDILVVDEDGELFLEPVANIWLRIDPSTPTDARYRLNRNYTLRGGVCSLYEYYRLMGVRKDDIYDFGIDWIKYIGWHADCLNNDDVYWVDCFIYPVTDDPDGNYYVIDWGYFPIPICCDPPEYVMEMCHMYKDDLASLPQLEDGDNVTRYIEETIQDNAVD